MDELSRHNRRRWNELAAAGVQYSRPWLDLDAPEAFRPDLAEQARRGGAR